MRVPLATRLATGLVALFVLVGVVACGDDSSDSGSADTTAATTQEADDATATTADGTSEAKVEIVDSDLGRILADSGSGLTLYAFVPDTESTSACVDACADAWPPLAGPASAGDGVDASLLGEITRDDGTKQASYGGHPLYMFAGDAKAGETNGQGSGDKWHVIDASGTTVTEDATDGGTAETTTTAADRSGY